MDVSVDVQIVKGVHEYCQQTAPACLQSQRRRFLAALDEYPVNCPGKQLLVGLSQTNPDSFLRLMVAGVIAHDNEVPLRGAVAQRLMLDAEGSPCFTAECRRLRDEQHITFPASPHQYASYQAVEKGIKRRQFISGALGTLTGAALLHEFMPTAFASQQMPENPPPPKKLNLGRIAAASAGCGASVFVYTGEERKEAILKFITEFNTLVEKEMGLAPTGTSPRSHHAI